MTLLILADDDSIERNIKPVPTEVVISCGDLADEMILRVARSAGSSHILAVKGNHDSSAAFAEPIKDLHLKEYIIDGVRFGGFQGCWRYKPRGHYLYDQHEVDRLLETFPPVDVFIAHNSPRHVHDREDGIHFGFEAFSAYIERARPRLFIHGHQHLNRETQVAGTKVLGVFGLKRVDLAVEFTGEPRM